MVLIDHSEGLRRRRDDAARALCARSGRLQRWLGRSDLADGSVEACQLYGHISDLIRDHSEAGIIAVDIPIGLPEKGPRRADTEARQFVGPRRSSEFPKKSWNGMLLRRRLLEANAILLPDELSDGGLAPADDVLDAAAAAWTAGRIAEEKARSLPDPPEKHPGGRGVAIWY